MPEPDGEIRPRREEGQTGAQHADPQSDQVGGTRHPCLALDHEQDEQTGRGHPETGRIETVRASQQDGGRGGQQGQGPDLDVRVLGVHVKAARVHPAGVLQAEQRPRPRRHEIP